MISAHKEQSVDLIWLCTYVVFASSPQCPKGPPVVVEQTYPEVLADSLHRGRLQLKGVQEASQHVPVPRVSFLTERRVPALDPPLSSWPSGDCFH